MPPASEMPAGEIPTMGKNIVFQVEKTSPTLDHKPKKFYSVLRLLSFLIHPSTVPVS